MMTVQSYLQARLQALKRDSAYKKPAEIDRPVLAQKLIKLLLSRKFRKYAVGPELATHIESAVSAHVAAGTPINLTFLNGAYKLWRLEESPEVDWAEFFTVLHYTDWVKEICALYEPGVWFDFFEDDLIVPRLNGMKMDDVEAYLVSFQRLLDFVRPYQPHNLRMTLTRVGGQFESKEAFYEQLDENIVKVSSSLPDGVPVLDERQLAMVDLNARPELVQADDPQWRERLYMLHDAYSIVKRGTGYHYTPSKILVFVQPLPNGMVLGVGTVRSSIAKFWIGVGALRRGKNGEWFPVVLSPSQLQNSSFEWQDLEMEGLEGRNFRRIRVLRG